MLSKRHRLMLALVLLPLLLLACGRGKKTPSPEPKIPVSQEAADRLEQKLKESINREGDGSFDLEITDSELTSYLVFKMDEQANGSDDLPLKDLQVQFSGGQMIFSGKLISVLPFDLDVRVAASAQVEDGQLDISVTEARAGAIPLPKGLLKNISRIINESIAEAPEQMEKAVEITGVDIGEGVMQISGRITENVE